MLQTIFRYAADIKIQDTVYIFDDGKLFNTTVKFISKRHSSGMYSPITGTGTLFVENILSSAYATYDHETGTWIHVIEGYLEIVKYINSNIFVFSTLLHKTVYANPALHCE